MIIAKKRKFQYSGSQLDRLVKENISRQKIKENQATIIDGKQMRRDALSQEKIMTKYMLSFYDLFDGWIGALKFSENKDDLIKERDAKNAKLDASNIECGEHYAVLEDKGGMWIEIDCPMDRLKK